MITSNHSAKYFKTIQTLEGGNFKALAKTLLEMEQNFYNQQNGSASKLTHLKFFKLNEEDISALQRENLNAEILCDFGRILQEYGIITSSEMEDCITDFEEYTTEFFQYYYSTSDSFSLDSIESALKRSAFGGSFFEEFDYKEPNSAQAMALKESYSSFPKYAIEDIDQRNAYTKEVAILFKAKTNESAHKHMGITFSYGCSLSDTSNSDWLVKVFIENTYMLVYNAFNTI
jgi:hypothetical protein